MYNGPEFMAKAIKRWLSRIGVNALYIELGSHWENRYTESFNGNLKDELLNRAAFYNVLESEVLIVR